MAVAGQSLLRVTVTVGLSNEERLTKFFWNALGWRRKLSRLATVVGDARVSSFTSEEAATVVTGWIATVDTLVGAVHLAGGGGSAYWLTGESEQSLCAMLADPYLLENASQPPPETPTETLNWWDTAANYSFTAGRLVFPPFKGHEGLAQLARWWDCYGYMSALWYAINRYEDGVFKSEVRERFTRLCGEIINRRFEVCFGQFNEDNDEPARVEQYLLTKHNIFHALLDAEQDVSMGTDAGKKSMGTDAGKKSMGTDAGKKFDGYALYERVAKMSTKDMADFFATQREGSRNRERAYITETRARAAESPAPDGLFGPTAVVP